MKAVPAERVASDSMTGWAPGISRSASVSKSPRAALKAITRRTSAGRDASGKGSRRGQAVKVVPASRAIGGARGIGSSGVVSEGVCAWEFSDANKQRLKQYAIKW